MDPTDRDALERAIVACRSESAARDRQIDSMLYGKEPQPWERVGEFAARCVQGRSLDLMPWQRPPMFYANQIDSALREPFGDPSGRREAGEVLQRLLRNGLSKYEPDPLAAIAEAEQRTATR